MKSNLKTEKKLFIGLIKKVFKKIKIQKQKDIYMKLIFKSKIVFLFFCQNFNLQILIFIVIQMKNKTKKSQ